MPCQRVPVPRQITLAEPAVADHEVGYAWKLYKEGAVREMYSCLDRRMSVMFALACDSVNEVRSRPDGLPFVQEKSLRFDFIPLGPFSYFKMLY